MATEQPRQRNQLLLSSFILIFYFFFTHLGQPPPSLPRGRLPAHKQVPVRLQAHGPIAGSWQPQEANRHRCSTAGWWLLAQPGWEMERNPSFGAEHLLFSI